MSFDGFSSTLFGTPAYTLPAGVSGPVAPATEGLLGFGGAFNFQGLQTLLSSFNALASGFGESQTFEAEASIARQQAADAQAIAEFNVLRRRRQARSDVSTARVTAAAQGSQISGSVLDVIGDIVLESELDVALINAEARSRARAFESRASKSGRKALKARTEGVFGAGKVIVDTALDKDLL